MTYNEFISKLNKYYDGIGFGGKFYVKWYMQNATFSYEIHNPDTAFLGKPLYISKVFWHSGKEDFTKILKDIRKSVKSLTYK